MQQQAMCVCVYVCVVQTDDSQINCLAFEWSPPVHSQDRLFGGQCQWQSCPQEWQL